MGLTPFLFNESRLSRFWGLCSTLLSSELSVAAQQLILVMFLNKVSPLK